MKIPQDEKTVTSCVLKIIKLESLRNISTSMFQSQQLKDGNKLNTHGEMHKENAEHVCGSDARLLKPQKGQLQYGTTAVWEDREKP